MLPMPKVALLPIFMLWFGLHDSSKIYLRPENAPVTQPANSWESASAQRNGAAARWHPPRV